MYDTGNDPHGKTDTGNHPKAQGTGLTGIGHAPPPVRQMRQEKKGPPPFQLPPIGPLGSGTTPRKLVPVFN